MAAHDSGQPSTGASSLLSTFRWEDIRTVNLVGTKAPLRSIYPPVVGFRSVKTPNQVVVLCDIKDARFRKKLKVACGQVSTSGGPFLCEFRYLLEVANTGQSERRTHYPEFTWLFGKARWPPAALLRQLLTRLPTLAAPNSESELPQHVVVKIAPFL
jgi:hypothetical protein